MSRRQRTPTRTLSRRPHLDQLRRQAKELIESYRRGDADAAVEIRAHYHGADTTTFALHDAQLVIARAYGFQSWPKLKAFVDGVTVRRLASAIRDGDLEGVRTMLAARPELVNVDQAENDEHKPLHIAVLARRPEIVRLLMQRGADPHCGIWPHREATGALTLADERGDVEIAAIVRDEESRRAQMRPESLNPETLAALSDAFEHCDEDGLIGIFAGQPSLVRLADDRGRTALHWAAVRLWPRLAAWLLDNGLDANARTSNGEAPRDLIGLGHEEATEDVDARKAAIVALLRRHDDETTARDSIASGDVAWLRAAHAEGRLADQRGLVTHAVRLKRPEVLSLLLELGLDPDERDRVGGLDEEVRTWGGPLRDAVIAGRLDLVQILLAHGADPDTNVYAASSALFEAHKRGDDQTKQLLEQRGAGLGPSFVGELGLVDHAARLLADESASGPHADGQASRVARELIWGALGSPSPEIVRLALPHIDWPRDDGQWHGLLENGLYLGPRTDRARHFEAFRLVLDRCHPDVRSRRGTTLLHEVTAARGGLTADDRVAYATALLDAGARLDVRDDLLESTPLGWACRWGRIELVRLFVSRGADPVEADASPWASPAAWARKKQRDDVLADLRQHGAVDPP
jgi:ankyrin repeat protein